MHDFLQSWLNVQPDTKYVQCESKNFTAYGFLKHNITRLLSLCVHIYAKLQNFIQLPPTLTKLCHIKHVFQLVLMVNFRKLIITKQQTVSSTA